MTDEITTIYKTFFAYKLFKLPADFFFFVQFREIFENSEKHL